MKKLLYLFVAQFLLITLANSQDISLMTYNIRYDNPKDGENSWPNRKVTLLNQIRFYKPDIFGTQEGLEHQLKYMETNLQAYTYTGIGRGKQDGQGSGEYSAIFYNTNKYTSLKSSTFWLSPTPERPSRGWDAALNRICSYVQFQDKKTKKRFWVFNTHFDHRGVKAREKSAELIIKKIEMLNTENLPVILMGDFNLVPDEPPIQFITKYLHDSQVVSQQQPFGPVGTFNGFEVNKRNDKRIDYIFISKNIKVKKYAVLANVKEIKYPSDHFPVLIEIELLLNNSDAQSVLPTRGICAHRGAMETHPENTLAAIREAVRLGAHMIELDVRMSKDGHLLLLHDRTVDRTTDGKGEISMLTLEQARQLDAGSWKSERFKGERIPMLSEALAVIPSTTWINIHLKGGEALGRKAARLLIEKERLQQAFLACGSEAAEGAKSLYADILICNMERQENRPAYITETIRRSNAFIQLLKKRDDKWLNRDIELLKQNRVRINYCCTDSEQSARELFRAGAGFILTNRLSALLDVAESEGIKRLNPQPLSQ